AQGIQSAAKKLDKLHLNEQERRAYERYKKSTHDDASFNFMISTLQEEARAETHAKTRAQTQAEERAKSEHQLAQKIRQIAQSLKKAGLTNEQIAAHTHLTAEEIQSIDEEIKI